MPGQMIMTPVGATPNSTSPGTGDSRGGDSLRGQDSFPLLMLASELRNKIYECCADVYLSSLDNADYHARPLNGPPGAIPLSEIRPNGAANQHMLSILYNHFGLTVRERMNFIMALGTHGFPDLQRPEFTQRSARYPALLLTSKQVHREARGILYARVAFDFIPFPGVEQCWVRTLGRFRPWLVREVDVTLWDFEQPVDAPSPRGDNLRRVVAVVSDLHGALRRAPRLERVNLAVHLGPRSAGVRVDCLRGVSSCLDLHVDAAGLLREFLLRQARLRVLEVGGCAPSRAFAPGDLQALAARGVKVLDAAVGEEKTAPDPYDVFDLSDEEVDWADWEEDFGEASDNKEEAEEILPVAEGMGFDGEEGCGSSFLHLPNT